jgi:hypothetical protein
MSEFIYFSSSLMSRIMYSSIIQKPVIMVGSAKDPALSALGEDRVSAQQGGILMRMVKKVF